MTGHTWAVATLLVVVLAFPATAGGTPPPPPTPESHPAFDTFRRAAALGFEPLLVHVFGDPAVLARLDSLGAPLPIDLDGDRHPEALAWREGAHTVAALDDDGDLGSAVAGGSTGSLQPDRDSDAFVADLGSDGTLDRVIDHVDLDGDGDADRMDLYELTSGPLGVDGVGVTVVFDLDDDDAMFAVTEYSYHANRDMWQSDFDGDGCFVAGQFDDASQRWVSAMENPFCFYDWNSDGVTDEALRMEGRDCTILSMRWSIDADGDASADHPRDYDVSITATGRTIAPEALRDSVQLRDGRHLRFVAWKHARDLALWALWDRILFVWDEDDHNTAPFSEAPDRERWEGVIAESFRGFPQVGGPSCGTANKRYELDADGSGRCRLYYSRVDRKVHLHGAESGLLQLAAAAGRSTRSLSIEDTDRNGYFDTWTYGKGAGEDPEARTLWSRRAAHESIRELPYLGPELRARWRKEKGSPPERERFERQRTDLEAGEALAMKPKHARAERVYRLDCEDLSRRSLYVSDAGKLPTDGTIVDLVVGPVRLHGQGLADASSLALLFVADRSGEQRDGAREAPRLEVDPPRPASTMERVRVDRWFKTGIAFESEEAAYRTYNGVLDVFVKSDPPRLVLRTPLGDYHTPQPWGTDPLVVGAGPGLGGVYVFEGREPVPLFGPEALRGQHVVEDGPLRCAVVVDLAARGIEIARRWDLTAGSATVFEHLTVTRAPGDSVTIAFALPRLESMAIDDARGIVVFGRSDPTGPAFGLAGRIVDPVHASRAEVEGQPAMSVRVKTGATLRAAWLAGSADDLSSWATVAARRMDSDTSEPLRCAIR